MDNGLSRFGGQTRYVLDINGSPVRPDVLCSRGRDALSEPFSWDIEFTTPQAKIYYPFYDVLFLTVCAVIGGAEGWEDIEDFGEVHIPWCQSKGLFKNGIPVHDTIARIISGIKPEPFQAAFVRWTQAINQHTDGALVAIDGKTLRSSYDRELSSRSPQTETSERPWTASNGNNGITVSNRP